MKNDTKFTIAQLMDLPKEEIKKLDKLIVPNNDEKTDEEAWRRRGVKAAKTALEDSAEAINILLGKKTS